MGETQPRHITWSHSAVTPEERSSVLGHLPATVWFTGLSGSGKSTIAHAVEQELVRRGVNAYVLDGDNLRHGLNADLGFSPKDREENIRRAGEICRILFDAGLITLTAFISPYARDRERARSLHPEGGFVEVYVRASLEVCEGRDPKGLYKRARQGEIQEFSGVSAPYEEPVDPELVLDTESSSVDECARAVLGHLQQRGVLRAR